MTEHVTPLDTLRRPFFFLAAALLALAAAAEGGLSLAARWGGKQPPGWGITSLVLLDLLLVYVIGLMLTSVLVPERFGKQVQGRLQGILTLLVSLVVLIVSILAAIAAFLLLMLMVSLLVAAPFGTIIYLGLFGTFDRGGAAAILSLAMALKLGFAGCLLAAHQRFLRMKSLVLLILFSLLMTVAIGFLHGLVPTILVSITDMIGALVTCIVAAVWALVFLISSIVSIVKAIA